VVAATVDYGLSFLRGMFASVNPCGFVLLPTYLVYFLGLEASGGALAAHPDQRASVRRALLVGTAVSSGFMAVFVVVGLIASFVDNWLVANAKYATVAIGGTFVVLGTAMLAGYRPRFAMPHLGVAAQRRTVGSMAVYGVAYAVASLGCTMVLFLPSIVDGRREGVLAGVASVGLYGAGMGLVVVALTVSLATANGTLLRVLRGVMRHVDLLAAAFCVLAGLYLIWYFVVVDVQGQSDSITAAVERWGNRVRGQLAGHWELIAVVLGAVVAVAALYAFRRPRRSDGRDGAERSELVGLASAAGDGTGRP